MILQARQYFIELQKEGIINLKFTKGLSNSAQYSCMHDSQGDLIVACADMSIIEEPEFLKQVIEEIEQTQPKIVLMDCNLSMDSMSSIIEHFQGKSSAPDFIIEPTSYIKAKRISGVEFATFPNNKIQLVTPTIEELNTMYESMEKVGNLILTIGSPFLMP